MRTSKRSSSIVGVDVAADSIAAAEVVTNGSSSLGSFAIAPLEPGISQDGEITDPEALGLALKELFAEHKLSRNVRVGIANQRVIVRTVRMPIIVDPTELETAIRFQVADRIAMDPADAVMDWQVLEDDPGLRASGKMDAVVVAARRESVEPLTDAVERAGLRPVGIDLSAFAMIRALSGAGGGSAAPSYEDGPAGAEAGAIAGGQARLLCNFADITNLVVARGSSCLFSRVSPFGIEGIAQRLSEDRELTLEHSRQWLAHVGLTKPIEAIEGDPEIIAAARDALAEGVSRLAGDLRLSLDYYGTQEGAVMIEEIVICGAGSVVAGVAEQIELELGCATRTALPPALAAIDRADAARLTLPFGLGLEA